MVSIKLRVLYYALTLSFILYALCTEIREKTNLTRHNKENLQRDFVNEVKLD